MARIAIIGTGIAGLGCAYFLRHAHEITVFEQADYAGGHANTVTVPEGEREVSFDTGFMVFNRVTYPHLTRLFADLDVATQPASMSFSVQHRPAGLEFCGTGLNHLFAQRRNLFRPRFWRLLRQINRFNREAAQTLQRGAEVSLTVAEYVAARNYGTDFLHLFLVPMSAAVWSAPPEKMREFPAVTLLRFFHNHGFLGLHTQHPWFTVTGGSRNYVRKIVEKLRPDCIRRQRGVVKLHRNQSGARLTLADGTEAAFDKVILACHADQALRLLTDATGRERALLKNFHYQANEVVVHTDRSVMPRRRLAWASWNYRIDPGIGAGRSSTHYWMNSLQGVSHRADYFVSLNYRDRMAPEKILRRIDYEHPLFDVAAIQAQGELPGLNRISPQQSTYFCGSYFRYGFHEDAFGSAVDLCEVLLQREPWRAA